MNIYKRFNISEKTYELSKEVLEEIKDKISEIDEISEYNSLKVIESFQKEKISGECFSYTSGYGYNDYGREKLEKVYSRVFKTEDALVRPSITCGTHALNIVLKAILRPGDTLYCPLGKPYDTLEEIIGIRKNDCSLMSYGIKYKETSLLEEESFNYEEIEENLKDNSIKLVEIQRSKGYATRKSFTIEKIKEVIDFIKERRSDIVVMVDNCYGEFVEKMEPSEVGADVIAGSLIKNPGGALAPTGGYIVGKKDIIEKCAYTLNAPGLGQEVGASLNVLKDFYQGFFLSPSIVSAALKTAVFASAIFSKLGYKCVPEYLDKRTDIIQSIIFNDKEKLCKFCEGIQSASPVDSHVTPYPTEMAGYDSKVIMAAGAFVQGSSIELSADGPLREPYAVYFQGGVTFSSGKLGILKAVENIRNLDK